MRALASLWNVTLPGVAHVLGRVLIVGIFVWDGALLVRTWEGSIRYMESFGIPGFVLPFVAMLQLLGSAFIVLGFLTRPTALAFAAFCVGTAVFFHRNLAVSAELLHFGKDIALAGGFLFLFAAGAGKFSLDRLWRLEAWPFLPARDAPGAVPVE